MPIVRLTSTALLLAILAIGGAGAANAAISTRLADGTTATSSDVTPIHWEYRHHHRYWVPDRRRRDDHRR